MEDRGGEVEMARGLESRGVEYVGTVEPGSQALFFCQALFVKR